MNPALLFFPLNFGKHLVHLLFVLSDCYILSYTCRTIFSIRDLTRQLDKIPFSILTMLVMAVAYQLDMKLSCRQMKNHNQLLISLRHLKGHGLQQLLLDLQSLPNPRFFHLRKQNGIWLSIDLGIKVIHKCFDIGLYYVSVFFW